MALLSDWERELAKELLQECKEKVVDRILNCDSLVFDLCGLEYMNDDPAEVDVLYCRVVEPSGQLQEIVDTIVTRFVASGLMKREHDHVKLHCTLINTLFRKSEDDFVGNQTKGVRETFDAKPLLENWNNLKLGEVTLEEIHLSQHQARKRAANGYYLSSDILRLV